MITAEVVHGSRAPATAALLGVPVVHLVALAAGASPLVALAAAAVYLVTCVLAGLTRARTTVESQGALWAIGRSALAVGTGGVVMAALEPGLGVGALLWMGAGALAVSTVRTTAWMVVATARRRGYGLANALVVGSADGVERATRRMRAFPEAGLQLAATCLTDLGDEELAHKQALDLIDRRAVDHVLAVEAGAVDVLNEELLLRAEGSGIAFSVIPALSAYAPRRLRHRIGDLGVLPIGEVRITERAMLGKRAFDVAASLVLIALLLPVLAAAAIAIAIQDGRPILYTHDRVGRGGRLFRMYKFRSMIHGAVQLQADLDHLDVADGLLFRAEDDPRITKVGAVLRRLSIDELPQLFNVLLGDMSLVGPRPLAVEPDDFDEVANKRHAVRPGVTGPWQVHGGNALSYTDMVDLDLAYISSWSFRADLGLLIRTIPALIVRRAPC